MATRSWSTRTGGLKSEVARLRDKIIDVELDSRVERAALKVLCQQVGTDPETFKKRAWLEIAKEAIGDNRDRVQRAVCRKLGPAVPDQLRHAVGGRLVPVFPHLCPGGLILGGRTGTGLLHILNGRLVLSLGEVLDGLVGKGDPGVGGALLQILKLETDIGSYRILPVRIAAPLLGRGQLNVLFLRDPASQPIK